MLLSEGIFGLCVPPNYLFSPPFFSASDVSAGVIQYFCSQTCTFQNHRHLKVSGNWDQSLVHRGPHGKEYQNQFWPFRATPKKVKPSTFLGSYLMSNKQYWKLLPLAPELAGHDPPRLRVALAQLQGEKSAGLALAFHPHSTEAVKFFATNDTTCYKKGAKLPIQHS